MNAPPDPARLPPPGLPGLDPAWSRRFTATDHTGTPTEWHLLDHGPTDVAAASGVTVLCVHGNPSWSYLFRDTVRALGRRHRVIAVDQLDMGFSERTGRTRRLGDRVDDLDRLTTELGIDGPVMTIAHDWGGPVSLGWALRRHAEGRLAGVVLTNTAVHQPEHAAAPSLIRLARSRALLRPVTVRTATFIRGAVEMCRPRLDADVRAAYFAPYESADRREAIADFVADIPLEPDHPSAPALDAIAAGLGELSSVPTLLCWGIDDPVFSELYLADFEQRLPHADVHRVVGAHHFVQEEADVAGVIDRWVDQHVGPPAVSEPVVRATATVSATEDGHRALGHALTDRADDTVAAIVEMGATASSTTFAELDADVEALAAGFGSIGVSAGDRAAVLVPPGRQLATIVYACWRLGVELVLVDAGLGVSNIRNAVRTARPDHIIGIDRAMAAAAAMRWPGRRIAVGPESRARALVTIDGTVENALTSGHGELAAAGAAQSEPNSFAPAALVFTSGSTGPSKGVRYDHRRVRAQIDLLASTYAITADDRLVAAFAPFALYGPALGIPSVVPDMDVTAPGSLTASALADAVAAVDATLVFASPTAFANVLATSGELTPAQRTAFESVRLGLSAGAPVRPELLARVGQLLPNAAIHTPYGMTEVLPVADVSLSEIDQVADGDGRRGVLVGRPCAGVEVGIAPLDDMSGLTVEADVVGEVVVQAPHTMLGYERLASITAAAVHPFGGHRTGDVGQLDVDGRLWISGRTAHLIHTNRGPVAPVPYEHAAERVEGVVRAAAVGVGPLGAQVVAVVVEQPSVAARGGVADAGTTAAVRAAAADLDLPPVAAVLAVRAIPVDRRHEAKVGRGAVGQWAGVVLQGGRPPKLK